MTDEESGWRGTPDKCWLDEFLLPRASINVALTLTLRQGIRNADGGWVPITKFDASKNVSRFLKRLNDEIFGNGSRRYRRRLDTVTVIEGDFMGEKRMHVHMAIQFPEKFLYLGEQFSHMKFRSMIYRLWSDSLWGHEITDYRSCYDQQGWIEYLLKEGPDAIDINNVHLQHRTDHLGSSTVTHPL